MEYKQMTLDDYIKSIEQEEAPAELCEMSPAESVCKHSGHACNKKQLWEIAKDLDNNFCPHVCCRLCSDFECGARCNGANKEKQKEDISEWLGDDFIPAILSKLKNNSLMEVIYANFRAKIAEISHENIKVEEYANVMNKSFFRLSRDFYFEVNGQSYFLHKPYDNPPFEKTAIMTIHKIGPEHEKTVANLLARDLIEAFQEMEEGEN